MPEYLSGAYALADARIRLAALPPDQAILMLEGRDDVRLFAAYCLGVDALIPCGGKRKLLEAYSSLRAGEETKMLFVADCDYDVPAGALTPKGNLILTAHVDVEIDLISLGVLDRVVLEVVPAAVASTTRAAQIAAAVRLRATALAEAFGRFRQLSAVESLGLHFDGLNHRRYREPGSENVDLEKLARSLYSANPSCSASSSELAARAIKIDGGLLVCQGKDMIESLQVVLHQDFGVEMSSLAGLPSLIRLAATPDQVGRWSVVARIDAWQQRHGRRVLDPNLPVVPI